MRCGTCSNWGSGGGEAGLGAGTGDGLGEGAAEVPVTVMFSCRSRSFDTESTVAVLEETAGLFSGALATRDMVAF